MVKPRTFPAADAQWPLKAAVQLRMPELFEQIILSSLSIPAQIYVDVGKGLWSIKSGTKQLRPR